MKINGKPDGGGSAVITGLSVTENGIYIATGVDGYNPVEVDVPIPSFVTETLSVSANNTYYPGQGVDGFSQVIVDVQPALQTKSVSVNGLVTPDEGYYGLSAVDVSVPAPAFVTETLSVTENNTYYPGTGVDGFSQVVVNVPQSVTGFTEKELTEGQVTITNLNNSASYVANNAFINNQGLQTANLPNVSVVYSGAFQSCKYLSQVNLPICEYIYTSAFQDCQRLQDVSLPACKRISNQAFRACTMSLVNVSLPVCEFISNNAFENCWKLETIYAPVCSFLSNNVFTNCSKLSDVTLTNCYFISNNVFSNCTSLETIDLPNLIFMGDYAFNRCTKLSSLSVPNVVWIGGLTFELCTSMSEYNFPNAVYVSGATFNQCPDNITTMSLPAFLSTARWYTNGVFLNNQIDTVYLGTECYGVPSYADVMSGTAQITSLYVNAYEYSKYLTAPGWSDMSSNILPYGDPSKPMLQYSDGLIYGDTKGIDKNYSTYLGISASDVTKVSLPNCVGIMSSTFQTSPNLSEVYLPECRLIAQSAFTFCGSLSKLTLGFSGICQLFNSQTFQGTRFWNKSGSIFVPASLVDSYKTAQYWSYFSSCIFPIE